MKNLVIFWLQGYVKQGRFIIVLLMAFSLFVLNSVVYSLRYSEDYQTESTRVRTIEEAYAQVESPNDLAGRRFFLIMPFSRDRFIVDNNLEEVPTGCSVGHLESSLPFNPSFYRRQIQGLWDIDLAFLVGTVFSFLAIVLAFDSINGERESGTLKLLISNSVKRSTIVLSKTLAIMITLAVPLLVGMLVNYLYLGLSGVMSLGTEDLLAALFIYLIALILILFYTGLSILVSSLTRHSITSLIFLLLIWIVLVVVLPGVAKPLAKELSPIASPEEITEKRRDLQSNFNNSYRITGAMDRAPEMARADNFSGERKWNEMRRTLITGRQDVTNEQMRLLKKQAGVARSIARITPNTVFKLASARIAGTDYLTVIDFLKQADGYRSILFNFLEEQDARDPESPHLLYSDGRGYLSAQPLTADIPKFKYIPTPLFTRMLDIIPDFILLFSVAMCALIWAVLSFNRYDVR